jgi:hypothetical protein
MEEKTNPINPGPAHVENGQAMDKVATNDGPKKDHTFQPPELVRNMTPEERAGLEKKLVRKIDLRLLPMIILMYILNYIDR